MQISLHFEPQGTGELQTESQPIHRCRIMQIGVNYKVCVYLWSGNKQIKGQMLLLDGWTQLPLAPGTTVHVHREVISGPMQRLKA